MTVCGLNSSEDRDKWQAVTHAIMNFRVRQMPEGISGQSCKVLTRVLLKVQVLCRVMLLFGCVVLGASTDRSVFVVRGVGWQPPKFGLLHTEDEDTEILRNVWSHTLNYIESDPRRIESWKADEFILNYWKGLQSVESVKVNKVWCSALVIQMHRQRTAWSAVGRGVSVVHRHIFKSVCEAFVAPEF